MLETQSPAAVEPIDDAHALVRDVLSDDQQANLSSPQPHSSQRRRPAVTTRPGSSKSRTTAWLNSDQAGPDSRGLYQQRNNWGTLALRMNPAWAAGAFMLGPHQGHAGGLLQLAGW